MRHSHYFQWLSLPLLSVAVTQQLYAQPNESLPTVELEPVVITIDKSGMALANRITQMPHTTKVIYEEQIQEQATGSRQLADVMAQLIPSLGVSSGTTSNFGQTMHGRQVQFLLNGVPLTGSRTSLDSLIVSIPIKLLELKFYQEQPVFMGLEQQAV